MKKIATILLIGACGSGKTWTMKKLINSEGLQTAGKFRLIRFLTNGNICLLGKYTGDVFDGSDRLSMAVSKDFVAFKKIADKNQWTVIAEGDRFTNKKFIEIFNPIIIKITDDGSKGRFARKSQQTNRHIKSIATRVSNIKSHYDVKTSNEALEAIKKML